MPLPGSQTVTTSAVERLAWVLVTNSVTSWSAVPEEIATVTLWFASNWAISGFWAAAAKVAPWS